MKSFITLFKSLADETRIRILHILSLGSFHVNEIVEILKMGQSRVSRHLKILQDAELILSRREGTWIYYYLNLEGKENLSKELIEIIQKYRNQNDYYEIDFRKVQEIFNKRFQSTRAFFDKLTGETQKVQEQVLDVEVYKNTLLAFIPKNRRLLVDLGCGVGRLFPFYLKKVKRVIGVDFSNNMIALAKELNKESPKVEFIHANLEKLPLSDRIADVVVLSMVLHHLSSPKEAIKEAYRILKPNGTLCVIELNKHEKEFMRNIYADLWLGFERETLENWLKELNFKIKLIKEIITQMEFKIIAIKGEKK